MELRFNLLLSFSISLIIVKNSFSVPIKKISKHPIIIVVSYDGFNHEYLEKGFTPALDSLMKRGVRVPHLQPVFPTSTFPNHQSIATGLYSESHGIISNELFDPLLNKTIGGYDDDHEYWDYHGGVLPIWLYNERAGDDRWSAAVFWPGANQPYGREEDVSSMPTYYIPGNDYEGIIPWEYKVDTLISWIFDEEKPANLIFLYHAEPDTKGHAFGPKAMETKEELEDVDNRTAFLVNKLKEAGLFDVVNLIFLSDHGMEGVSQERLINITSMVDESLVDKRYGYTPSLQFIPKEGKSEELYRHLKNLSMNYNFTVYKKGELKHFSESRRILDVMIVAEPRYGFDDFMESIELYNAMYNMSADRTREYGVHGYQNLVKSMHPFLIAHGPAFRNGINHTDIHNVDIVPLICKILGIQEPPNNGSLARVIGMLKPEYSRN